jgi:homeobox protein YOX1/YHP1
LAPILTAVRCIRNRHIHIRTQCSPRLSTPCPTQTTLLHGTLLLGHMRRLIQQTHAPYLNYPSFQQLSETRYHSGQTGSYDRASPPSNLADHWRPPPLDVPVGGRVQEQAYYQYHADMQTPRTSNDLRSPHSVYSPASSIPQYQFPASPAYPARQNTSRGVVPTVTAANTPYQQSMAISHAPLDHHTNPMYRGSRPLPYARAPTAPSPVPYDVPPEIQEPTIRKKRKRADARQLEALNRMYARTAFPSTEERQQLARNLDMSARSVQIWFQNKRRARRQGGHNSANSSINQATVTLPEYTPPVIINPSWPPYEPYRRITVPFSESLSTAGHDEIRTNSLAPSDRPRAEHCPDMDPRMQWPGRGY